MYFLLNASPSLFDVDTSNPGFKLPRSMGHMMWRVLGSILCNHDSKVKSEKAGICDGVPSTAV